MKPTERCLKPFEHTNCPATSHTPTEGLNYSRGHTQRQSDESKGGGSDNLPPRVFLLDLCRRETFGRREEESVQVRQPEVRRAH